MKPGLARLPYNCCKMFMGWTLHMIMCVLLCYPVSFHMLQLLLTGRPISSFISLPRDSKPFPQVSKSFPQVSKSLQDTKSFPQVSKLFPQGSKVITARYCSHKLAVITPYVGHYIAEQQLLSLLSKLVVTRKLLHLENFVLWVSCFGSVIPYLNCRPLAHCIAEQKLL